MKLTAKLKLAKYGLLVTALSLSLLVLFAVMALAAGNERTKIGIAGMVPKNSVAFVMVDTPWWYQNIVNIKDANGKSILNDNTEFLKFEEKNGISLEKDIMSWAGRVGVCLLSIEETEPAEIAVPPPPVENGEEDVMPEEMIDDLPPAGNKFDASFAVMLEVRDASFAVMLEVRDHAMFLAKLPGLMHKLPADNEITWKEDFYAGITVRRSEIDFEGTKRQVALAEVSGWLVFAVGDGAMEKIVDTVNGKTPAFTDIPGMKEVFAQLPETNCSLLGFNGDSDFQLSQFPNNTIAGMAGVLAFSETENGLQLSSTTLATSDITKQQVKRYQSILKPPAGKALTLLPAGTFAVMSFCNPGLILTETKKTMLATAQSDEMRKSYEEVFAQMQPIQDMFNNITGEFAISGAWSKENGFGISIVGEHASALKVADTVKKLKAFFTQFEVPMTIQNGITQMPQVQDDANFPIQPAWMAKNTTWFALSTNVSWLKTAGPAKMPMLPPTAKGANSIIAVDLSFLSDFFDNKDNPLHLGEEDLAAIRALQLQKIQLICYGKISDDATMSQSVSQLNNWDWRNALRLAMDENGVFAKARQKAMQAQSMSNLKQLALATQMYIQENDETMPSFEELKAYTNMPRTKLWIQPTSKRLYLYNEKVAGKLLEVFDDPENLVLFYEQTVSDAGMRCVAFLDGHVEAVDEETWKELVKDNGL